MIRLQNLILSIGCGTMLLLVPTASGAFKYLHEGMQAPEFKATDVRDGAEITIDKMLDHGMVVILFWSTWSNRSMEELHDFEQIFEKYKNQQISFLAINVEGQQVSDAERARIMNVVDQLPSGLPVIIDDKLEIFYKFGVIAVPSTAVLDTTGALRYGPAGYSLKTKDLIVDSIEVLLGLREPSADTAIAEGYTPHPSASRYYQLAHNLFLQRMYERALDNAGYAINADSGFAAPYCLLGDIFLMMDSVSAAEASYTKALIRDNESIVGLTGLGEALRRSGNVDSAAVVLSRGLSLDSTYTPCLISLSLCLSSSGDIEGASRLIEGAHSLNPNDAMVLYYRGQIAREAGRLDLSAESYLRALELIYPSTSY